MLWPVAHEVSEADGISLPFSETPGKRYEQC